MFYVFFRLKPEQVIEELVHLNQDLALTFEMQLRSTDPLTYVDANLLVV